MLFYALVLEILVSFFTYIQMKKFIGLNLLLQLIYLAQCLMLKFTFSIRKLILFVTKTMQLKLQSKLLCNVSLFKDEVV